MTKALPHVLQGLHGVTPDQRSARCPAHEDHRASLSIAESKTGNVLLKCHAGCSTDDVVDAMGIEYSDLFPATSGQNATGNGHIVETYDYRDETGNVLFQVCRFDPKDFRQRRPNSSGGWIWKLGNTRRVLYCLPELLAASPEESVFVIEGEKDVNRLTDLGLVATCSVGGAGKWRTEYSSSLRNRHVIIIPDNDDPGRKHARSIAENLAGIAASVRSLELPDLPEKGDVSDWLKTGGTVEKLLELAEQSAEMNNRPYQTFQAITVEELLELAIPEQQELLAPIIREKEIVMLHAWRGVGKTQMGLGIAYAVASGGSFLRWKAPEPRPVLYLDGEMPAEAMQKRLAALVAADPQGDSLNPENLRFLCADLQDRPIPNLSTAEGQVILETLIEPVSLVVVDSVSTLASYGRENESESWLPMQDWALRLRRLGKSLLLLHHDGKGGSQRGTSRREDILDVTIGLRQPSDYSFEEGARFEVHFDKGRSLYGEAARPFEARFEVLDGCATWTMRDVEDVEAARVAALLNDGVSIRDAAQDIGISKSKVERLKKKAAAAGILA